MSGTRCICGEILSDVGYPCKHKLWAMTDTKRDEGDVTDNELVICLDYRKDLIEIWACSTCGSIGIYLNRVFHWFRPEEAGFRLLAELRVFESIKESVEEIDEQLGLCTPEKKVT